MDGIARFVAICTATSSPAATDERNRKTFCSWSFFLYTEENTNTQKGECNSRIREVKYDFIKTEPPPPPSNETKQK